MTQAYVCMKISEYPPPPPLGVQADKVEENSAALLIALVKLLL